MPTFVANRKMSPALRARVEASVRGKRAARRTPARLRALLRLVFVVTAIAVLVLALGHDRAARRALELRRAALLDELRAANASTSAAERASFSRGEAALRALAGPYPGDVRAIDLAAPGVLERPLFYVRGPVAAFGAGASLAHGAAASVDDTFVRCLRDPPASRAEGDVLVKVRAAYGATSPPRDVYRLALAENALRVLAPAFSERVRAAGDAELASLEQHVARARLADAKKALAAPLLLAVLDEPGDARVPADLDGERPHDVRVELYDAAAGTTLLRARVRVDPGAWSARARAEFASGLDACALAWDLRRR